MLICAFTETDRDRDKLPRLGRGQELAAGDSYFGLFDRDAKH